MDRITKYGYVLGARYFKTQKIKFIKEIKEEFEHSNFRLGEDKNGTKKSTQIFINKGDNQVVFITPYDTDSKSLRKKYKYYPFNLGKRQKENKQNLVKGIMVFLSGVVMALLLYSLALNFSGPIKNLLFFVIVVIIFISLLSLSGLPNNVNLNRNTMSLIVLMELLDQKPTSSMILVDNAVDSKHGYREALESITTKRNNQRIIALFLDCIAKGDQYYIVNKNEESLAEEIALELRSHGMQANSIKQNSYLDELLENYIYIISAKKDKDGDLYVDNTRSGKDNKINSKNLGVLSNILKKVNEK